MTDHPLTNEEILEVLETKQLSTTDISDIVSEIKGTYETSGSPLHVVEVAGGVQMATKPDMGGYIRRLYKERLTIRLSASALETLSIIAYKQPIARSEIEQIRGVEATGVMETLLERRLVKVVGRKETIGRPLLYGTTVEFLRQFGLKHLSELPDLDNLVPLEEKPVSDNSPQSDENPEAVASTSQPEEVMAMASPAETSGSDQSVES